MVAKVVKTFESNTFFASFYTPQCLILQILELFNALFYKLWNFSFPYFAGFRYEIPKIFNVKFPRFSILTAVFLLHFVRHNARGIASGSPVVAAAAVWQSRAARAKRQCLILHSWVSLRTYRKHGASRSGGRSCTTFRYGLAR